MGVQVTVALWMALALSGDIPGVTTLRPLPANAGTTAPATLPDSDANTPAPPPGAEQTPAQHPSDPSSKELQPQSRLLLVRFVDGEFAHAVQPLPGGKKGYKVPAGKPLDMKKLS